jgi:molecular chaperone DnaK
MHTIINRNSPIPIRQTAEFSTAANFQRGVDVVVLQGESLNAAKDKVLGSFPLDGIRKNIKGDAQIEITFNIDENGILEVRAEDIDTGNKQGIVISGGGRMSREDLLQMQLELRTKFLEDKARSAEEHLTEELEFAGARIDQFVTEFKDLLAADVLKESTEIKNELSALELDKMTRKDLQEILNRAKSNLLQLQEHARSLNSDENKN